METLKIPYHVSSTFVKEHPHLLFVYGQDWSDKGCLGQSWCMGKEPNTYPVPTLYKVCLSASDKYFTDNELDLNKRRIDEKIALIPRDGRPIIWLPKLGRGHSQMYLKAPLTYEYLIQQLRVIEYPQIEWDYSPV